jgi:hypothetical protein
MTRPKGRVILLDAPRIQTHDYGIFLAENPCRVYRSPCSLLRLLEKKIAFGCFLLCAALRRITSEAKPERYHAGCTGVVSVSWYNLYK